MPLRYSLSDSFVKGNDMKVLRVLLGCKMLQDVPLIQFEFFHFISKGEEIHIMGDAKSNYPVSMCGDRFGLSVHWLSVDVEYNPEKMLLRLMDFPWTRLSHSELGKAGHPGVLMMFTLTCFDLPTTLEVIQVLLGVQVITWIQ